MLSCAVSILLAALVCQKPSTLQGTGLKGRLSLTTNTFPSALLIGVISRSPIRRQADDCLGRMYGVLSLFPAAYESPFRST
ncbi:hypothetical protein F4777DRAFT_375279 [Nemania sp. FL0916]|nr:hypothetical protein F4777DRAFT_375279 [Nemania sp. FL0916]